LLWLSRFFASTEGVSPSNPFLGLPQKPSFPTAPFLYLFFYIKYNRA